MLDENEDLVERLNEVMEDNDFLRKQQQGVSQVRISLPGSHRNSGKSTPTYREDLDDTRAGSRSNTSASRRFVDAPLINDASSSEFEVESAGHVTAPRKSSAASSSRKSGGSVVGFETSDQVVTVAVTGALRPSRSRIATPFLAGETVNKLVTKPSSVSPPDEEESSHQVNFEPNVHVVEVPTPDDVEGEPGHHNRSVRGRIATPFIRDVPQKEPDGAVSDQLDTN